MKKQLLKIIFALLTSASLIVLLHHDVRAQSPLRTFTISPPVVDIKLAPGEHKEGIVKIINDSADTLTFNTTIQDFIVTDNIGTPDILPPDTLSGKYSGASWIGVSPTVVTVAPHQRAELSYFIQVPANARPGGHYAAIVYTPVNSVGVNGTGASVNTSIGTLFYTTIKGPITESAAVTKFKTKKLFEFAPANITTEIANYSDIHIRPEGAITLTNMLGGKSDVQSIAAHNIFPGVSRTYDNKLGKGFMLGLYHAKLSAVYGSTNLPLSTEVSFFVFPWRIAVFLLLLTMAIVVGYYYWRKRGNTPPPQAGSSNQ